MADALETLVKQLGDSGIVSPGGLKSCMPAPESPQTPEQLTQILVAKNQLTSFQAERVSSGSVRSLILGGYTLLDKIGAGGMGQVFKAEHRRMKRLVALKTLPASLTSDPSAVARFEREVEAAAKLSHPNIVTAYDADQADGVHFLVMEYIEGTDLSELVKKHGPCSAAKAIDYILQAARGLEFAHAEGVVHRDIKPANLLLDKKGTVKILDMGLARLDGSLGAAAGPKAELTGTGTMMGTVDYMSPEQAYNTKLADARADIYSLGCTLHFLLSGTAAYSGETLMEKLLAHRERPIPSLKSVRHELPNRIDAVFKKMVAKRVEDRFQKMSEVIAELSQCAAELGSSMNDETKSETPGTIILPSVNLSNRPTAVQPVQKNAAQAKPTGGNGNGKKRLLFGAAAGGLLALLLGVIVIIRDDKGKEIGRIELPPGQTMEVLNNDPKPAVTPRSPPSATTGLQSISKPISDINDPAFQTWLKDTSAKPAMEQIEAVSKKLIELNPGFDGKLTNTDLKSPPQVVNGVVTGLGIQTQIVADIAPIRALAGLRNLCCFGPLGRNGRVSDLSPLSGLSLSVLNIDSNEVTDLSPLKGMPLTVFRCGDNRITDLTPLKGMPLAYVYCPNNPILNLSPLQGAALTDLTCASVKVTDLSPLRGMPLANLNCTESMVADLTPLESCKQLKTLIVTKTQVTASQVAALQRALPNCKIEWDDAAKPKAAQSPTPAKPITDINSPAFQAWLKEVAAKPAAEQLEQVSKKLMELNPGFDGKLTGWKDEESVVVDGVVHAVSFVSDQVADIAPVRAFTGLACLRCFQVTKGIGRLSDLSPLKGMQVRELGFINANVSDISPLSECKRLKSLSIQGTKVTPAAVAALQNAMPTCKIYWDDPTKLPPTQPEQSVVSAKRISDVDSPAFQAWLKETQAKPAAEQIDAVSKKLIELNPGFNGKLMNRDGTGLPKIEGGIVTELQIYDDLITNIAPVRAFSGLTFFNCRGRGSLLGGGSSGKLTDLSPLQGMKLTFLGVSYTAVADLSPLEGMPLAFVGCSGTNVFDLSPLRQMPLTSLQCQNTAVRDVTPLYDCGNLRGLYLQGNALSQASITELRKALPRCTILCDDPTSPTRKTSTYEEPAFIAWQQEVAKQPVPQQLEAVTAKLIALNPGFDGTLTDINSGDAPFVENGAVVKLKLDADYVVDVSPLRALPKLKSLICSGRYNVENSFSDLAPLKGLPLVYFLCGHTQVSDLTPLHGMPLKTLNLRKTPVSDLSPLKDMALVTVIIAGTRVTDLTPLRGMPLKDLDCAGTDVSDLAPLAECPTLTKLNLSGTKVTAAGVAALQQALPNCKIDWEEPAKPAAPQASASGTK